MSVKDQVAQVVFRVRQEEQALVAALRDDERAAAGTVDVMSAKDLLAHITAAKQRETQRLIAIHQGETPANDDHDEAQVFAQHQDDSWQMAQDEAERVSTQFMAQVDAFTEDELIDAQRYAWMKGKPLSSHILIYGVWHPAGHLVEFYRRRGDEPQARRLYADLVAALGRPNMLQTMHGDGLNLYNLACAYAVTGQTDKALQLLPDALRLDAELIGEAQHDADLDALRANPTFQALITA